VGPAATEVDSFLFEEGEGRIGRIVVPDYGHQAY
jgi:hypothetical protein